MYLKDIIVINIYNYFNLDKNVTTKIIQINDKNIHLQIWDTSIDPNSNEIYKVFYPGTKGVFLIYDISNLHSFNNVKNYNKQIDENIPGSFKILIGYNNNNQNRTIAAEEGKKLANELKIDSFFEVSSSGNEKIDEMLNILSAKKLFCGNKEDNCLII